MPAVGAGSSSDSAKSGAHMGAGACGGFFATALLHPLDLIKTRLHVQDSSAPGRRLPQYRGLWDACRTIHRLEGIAGFYQGVWPNVIGNTASWGIYFYAYTACKKNFAENQVTGSALYLSAATVGGALTTMMLHPIFMIKTRLQLQLAARGSAAAAEVLPSTLLPAAQRDNYAGAWNAVTRMVREEGALSLYRGIGPSMLLVSHGSIQFLTYEHAKQFLLARRFPGKEESAVIRRRFSDGGVGESASEGPQLSAADLFAASTVAKVAAILGTYPYQVVRSCMQQRAQLGSDTLAYSSTSDTVRHIWRQDGGRGYYRGILPHILRSTPQATLTLMIYEYAQRALDAEGVKGKEGAARH